MFHDNRPQQDIRRVIKTYREGFHLMEKMIQQAAAQLGQVRVISGFEIYLAMVCFGKV